MSTAKKQKNKAEQYIKDVMSGKKLVCKWTRLAVVRHVDDLKNGHKRGLYFDSDAGQDVIDFFGLLKHSKGEWAGDFIVLEGWQEFILRCVFGWKWTKDDTRRFRTAYNEIPKKNGKTTLGAGVGNYLFIEDDEPGAEVYATATKVDQARLVWNEARNMIRQSPDLSAEVTILTRNLHVLRTDSKFEPLASDTKTMDGLNVHGTIVDELHAHRNRDLISVIESGGASRRQPLQFEITTAGNRRFSVGYDHHSYSQKILEGIIFDDSWFAIIFSLDEKNIKVTDKDGKVTWEDDDWTDPKVWEKANPNYGVSVKVDQLVSLCAKAKEIPADENTFRQLRLNQWVGQFSRWISKELWDKNRNNFDPKELLGRRCWAGLDLAKTMDISALALVFPPEDIEKLWKLLLFYWVPKDNIKKRVHEDHVPYDDWVKRGLIKSTPGNVTDYRFVRKDILEINKLYRIEEMAYDRMFANELVQYLADEGITMVEFGQGFYSMSKPTFELERLLLGGELAHNGDEVLTWMASNVAVRKDPAGNIKPDKEKSEEKIDGIVSVIMGIGRAIVRDGVQESIYEKRGILVL